MAQISIDGGTTFTDAQSPIEADIAPHWETITTAMDSTTKASLDAQIEDEERRAYLQRYLQAATVDLVVDLNP